MIENECKKRKKDGAIRVVEDVEERKDVLSSRKLTNELIYGIDAVARMQLHSSIEEKLENIPYSITHVFGNDYEIPWATFYDKPLIEKIVLLYVCGIDEELWLSEECEMEKTKEIFNQGYIVTKAPNATINSYESAKSMLMYKTNKKAKKRKVNQENTIVPVEEYIMSKDMLLKCKFPHPSYTDQEGNSMDFSGYVYTTNNGVNVNKILAMDCEMCLTENGSELTRISLIDENNNVLIDEIVKPDKVIIDYLTPYSGITPDMMLDVKVRLEDVQKLILEHVSSETILVGHSLENDLWALKLFHFKIIDTSVLYPLYRPFPQKRKLKQLAEQYLKKRIQENSHDSIEDAIATLDLVKLKIKKGVEFGCPPYHDEYREKLVNVLYDYGVSSVLIDNPNFLNKFGDTSASALAAFNDLETLKIFFKEINKEGKKLIWLQLKELVKYYDKQIKKNNDEEIDIYDINDILKLYDEIIEEIYNHLPKNTMFLLCTGHGNTFLIRKYTQHMIRIKNGLMDGNWTDNDDLKLNNMSDSVIRGICMVRIKT